MLIKKKIVSYENYCNSRFCSLSIFVYVYQTYDPIKIVLLIDAYVLAIKTNWLKITSAVCVNWFDHCRT